MNSFVFVVTPHENDGLANFGMDVLGGFAFEYTAQYDANGSVAIYVHDASLTTWCPDLMAAIRFLALSQLMGYIDYGTKIDIPFTRSEVKELYNQLNDLYYDCEEKHRSVEAQEYA